MQNFRRQKPLNELVELMDRVNMDELGVRARIQDEIARLNKFRVSVLGHKQEKTSLDIDTRNYAKYLLREGTLVEKRELLSCLQSRLILREREIALKI